MAFSLQNQRASWNGPGTVHAAAVRLFLQTDHLFPQTVPCEVVCPQRRISECPVHQSGQMVASGRFRIYHLDRRPLRSVRKDHRGAVACHPGPAVFSHRDLWVPFHSDPSVACRQRSDWVHHCVVAVDQLSQTCYSSGMSPSPRGLAKVARRESFLVHRRLLWRDRSARASAQRESFFHHRRHSSVALVCGVSAVDRAHPVCRARWIA
jgi:hypothetical protein